MADGDETALSPPALPFGLDSGRQTELLSALVSEARAREESEPQDQASDTLIRPEAAARSQSS